MPIGLPGGPGEAELAGAVDRGVRGEVAGPRPRPPRARWLRPSAPGAADHDPRRSAQQPQWSGTTHSSAAAAAPGAGPGPDRAGPRSRWGAGPARRPCRRRAGSNGSSTSSVNRTASSTSIPVSAASSVRNPSVQDAASTTTGSRAPSAVGRAVAATRAGTHPVAHPRVAGLHPFRLPGRTAAQPRDALGHSAPRPRPARQRQERGRDSRPRLRPGLAPGGPEDRADAGRDVDGHGIGGRTRLADRTAAGQLWVVARHRVGSRDPAGQLARRPPIGRARQGVQTRSARARRAGHTVVQCLAANDHVAAAGLVTCWDRSRVTRSPVLINTGQAVWHIPSTAQVCIAS